MLRNIVPTSALIGREVHTDDPDLIGQLEEILIDTENGVAMFALISFDGLHTIGESFVVVPWELMRTDLSRGGDGLLLHANREQLKTVRIKAQNLPNFADPQFTEKVYEHFGI